MEEVGEKKGTIIWRMPKRKLLKEKKKERKKKRVVKKTAKILFQLWLFELMECSLYKNDERGNVENYIQWVIK